MTAPYIPPIDPSNASDTQNFDDTFLDMEPVLDDPNEGDQTDTDQEREQTDTDRTDEESNATPSQSRSPSVVPPANDSVDVFDGYSFKGRHSILMDSDEEEEPEEEDEKSLVEGGESVESQEPVVDGALSTGDRTPKARTPELQQPSLPEEAPAEVPKTPTEPSPINIAIGTPRTSEDKSPPDVPSEKPATDSKRSKAKAPRGTVPRVVAKNTRVRREKSGVPALDRDLSDTLDEDDDVTEKEDEDWDFIEAADGEDRNGTQGPSLFARGVVDRYKLAVFRKVSTPAPSASRSLSGMSKASDLDSMEPNDSPSPSEKRRGRNPGLTFRKHPRQFLRQKSPHSKKSSTTKSLGHHTSATLSVNTIPPSSGTLTPSPSVNSAQPPVPSLKSKESALSVGAHSGSSGNADTSGVEGSGASDTIKGQKPVAAEGQERQKNKKLKKYKEGAEKMFSLFQSPRPS